MFPFLATPWALLGLLALPALAAIYLLRSRFRRVPVSSLMLWADQLQARQGGLRLDRLQTPLLFFLELMALALLAVAAADPRAATGQAARPLVVVLDDSYSMQAGGAESPRCQALAALDEELRGGGDYAVRFVLAGKAPQALGEPVRGASEALALLDGWKCRAPECRLEEAIGFAGELGGTKAVLLVLTDHAPAVPPEKGRVRWWAFGKARPNVAFVNAARSVQQKGQRCLLEIANLSAQTQATRLVIEAEGGGVVHAEALRLTPGQTRRVAFQVKPDTPALTARLGDDALDIDNRVTLLPEAKPPVSLRVRIADEVLRPLVERALQATGRTVMDRARPELLFTDTEDADPESPDTWVIRLLAEKDAEAFVGPFVLDRTNPLTEGLSLQGVVWGAGKGRSLPGMPVVLAGNVPLVTDAEGPTGGHELRVRLRPDLSTLQDTPAWPVLVWNIVQWRGAQAPGLRRVNLRLGESAVLITPPEVQEVEVIAADGSRRKVPVHDRHVLIPADDVGRYQVVAGGAHHGFAVNALDRAESDLRACAAGQWGEWAMADTGATEVRSLSWLLLLLVLGVLTAHVALVARGTRPVALEATSQETRAAVPGRLA
jgi:hypothetical protein